MTFVSELSVAFFGGREFKKFKREELNKKRGRGGERIKNGYYIGSLARVKISENGFVIYEGISIK